MLSQRLVVLFWYQGRIVALAQGTWLARCNLMMLRQLARVSDSPDHEVAPHKTRRGPKRLLDTLKEYVTARTATERSLKG
jgi:hypothetical protein